MANLIDSSFFVNEINIPNPGKSEIAQSINMFVNKYEPELLKCLLGYTLWKSYDLDSSTERFQNLINGVEYTCMNVTKYWRGLVYNNMGNPTVQKVIGFSQRPGEQIQAGITDGFDSDANSFVFDGTDGKPDYRGLTFIANRGDFGPMIENVDYSWDKITGTFLLLFQDDIFPYGQWITFQFNPVSIVSNSASSGNTNFSLIAMNIYWQIMNDKTIWTSGVGTKISKGDNVTDISPALKMNKAWNEFSRQTKELANFLLANKDVYPEYTYDIYWQNYCNFGTVNDFGL